MSSPETEFLLCTARVHADAARRERVRALADGPLDWERVLRLAEQHGVLPLLHGHVHALAPGTVPATVRDRLREAFHANALQNLRRTGELLKILRRFEAHGVRAIPYKGPTLTVSVYGDLGLRPFADLDLLVRRADFAGARTLLLEQGYRPQLPLSRAAERDYLNTFGQLPFERDDGDLVELHTEVAPRYYSFPLDPEPLWRRSRPIKLGGRDVPTLSPEDLLLVLCAHGAKHLWIALGWVCDVAELLRSHPAIDWAAAAVRARRARGERLLGLGVFLAHRLLDAPLPGDLRRKLAGDAAVRALAGGVERELFRRPDRLPGGAESSLFHLRAREHWRDGVRYCLGLALTTMVSKDSESPDSPPRSIVHRLLRGARRVRRSLGAVRESFPR